MHNPPAGKVSADPKIPAMSPRREATALLARLLPDTSRPLTRPFSEIARLRGLERLQALIEASRTLRSENPRAMLAFARLARCAADRLRVREYGKNHVADLRALAWTELGNAYRINDDMTSAMTAMQRAVHWCHQGSGNELLLVQVSEVLASLSNYQQRFDQGRDLMGLVERAHVTSGRWHLAGRALLAQASHAHYEGNAENSLILQKKAFELLDLDADPDLAHLALWNMIAALVQLGHFRVARRMLWRTRPLFEGLIAPGRVRWLEGLIFAGLDDFERAEAALQQARDVFLERGQIYPAARVGLEIARIMARQGRVEEVYNLCEELVTTFNALGISREAVVALLVLRRANLVGSQLVDGIEMALGFLRDLERQRRPVSNPD
jgi:tetratricopeptide (TPR) repeat protein